MEISKELIRVQKKEQTAASIVEEIEEQQRELKKKSHIFKVIHAASVIENMLETRLFQRYDIERINISYKYDYDMGNELYFIFYDFNDEQIDRYNGSDYIEPVDILKKAFDKLDGFNNYHIDENFLNFGEATFEINEELPTKIITLLLSQELKSILNFNELKTDLPENNGNSKKMKI